MSTENTPITELDFDETGPITLDAFIEEHEGLDLSVESIDRRPGNDSMNSLRYHFKCVISYQGRRYTFYYSMGEAHKGKKPDLKECLNGLMLDAQTIESFDDINDMAENYGYTKPSEAQKVWAGCLRTHNALKRVFPETFHILLEHTEGE